MATQKAFESLDDATKEMSVDIDGLTTGTERVAVFKDRDITVAGDEQFIELDGSAGTYVDSSNPANAELMTVALAAGGGVGSIVRVGVGYYRVNNSSPPTLVREIEFDGTLFDYNQGNGFIYFGGLLDADWQVRRRSETGSFATTTASITNNAGTADLATAWTNRLTLVYG